mmetsp:Transcript_77066/g.249477  ORF Transcript_77066/g.249477 Transcript_77066/m.249477 type:complete len:212 (+) Transcript_77066:504-1139(+)
MRTRLANMPQQGDHEADARGPGVEQKVYAFAFALSSASSSSDSSPSSSSSPSMSSSSSSSPSSPLSSSSSSSSSISPSPFFPALFASFSLSASAFARFSFRKVSRSSISRARSKACCFWSSLALSRCSFLFLASSSSFCFFCFSMLSNNCALKGHEFGMPGSFLVRFFAPPAFLASLRTRRLCSRTRFATLYFRVVFWRPLFDLPRSFAMS